MPDDGPFIRECTDCEAGKFANADGADECDDCGAGKYSAAAADACIDCRWVSHEGNTARHGTARHGATVTVTATATTTHHPPPTTHHPPPTTHHPPPTTHHSPP